MGCLTNYWESKLMDHTLKNDELYQPTYLPNLYLALFTATPVVGVDENTVSFANEVSAGGYARATLNIGASYWDLPATNRSVDNLNQISFATATESWGTVSHYGIMTHLTAQAEDNLIAYGTFSSSTAVASGNTVTISARALSITVDAGVYSNFLAHAWLGHIFGGVAYAASQPANLYVGLSTVNPGSDGTGIDEPDEADGYGRINHNTWREATDGVVDNEGAIVFAQATPGGWGTLNYAFITTSGTIGSGNMLFYGALTAPLVVAALSTARFDDAALSIGLD